MPPPSPAPGSAEDWLIRAKGKLALARVPRPDEAFYEDLCFFAQQGAELAIKAVYVRQGWTFEYIHILGALLDDLERNGLSIPSEVQEADQLTIFAALTRYPGFCPPVTEAKYNEAIGIAETVVHWADALIL